MLFCFCTSIYCHSDEYAGNPGEKRTVPVFYDADKPYRSY
ncbi:CxxxxCH/CxxCH domain-containing protein [Daejeonella sp.]